MNQKASTLTIFRIAGMAAVALMGYGIYLSFRGNIAGMYLGWSLLLVFCATAVLEIWWGRTRSGREEDVQGELSKAAKDISSSVAEAAGSAGEASLQLMRELKSVIGELAQSVKANTAAVREENARVRSETEQRGKAALDAIKAVREDLADSQRQIKQSLHRLCESNQSTADVQREAAEKLLAHSSVLKQELLDGMAAGMARAATDGNGRPDAGPQQKLFSEVSEKLTMVAEKLEKSSTALEESGNLTLVNQAELQAGIEMLNSGLAQILERVQSKTEASEEESAFLEKLHRTLEAFHERATDILIENSLKTREILIGGSPE